MPAEVAPGGHGGIASAYSASVGVTAFELDLFGSVRNLSQAALERYAASEEARRAAQITLVAEVASVYQAILADEHLLALSRQTLASRAASHQRQHWHISSKRSGLASTLSKTQAWVATACMAARSMGDGDMECSRQFDDNII